MNFVLPYRSTPVFDCLLFTLLARFLVFAFFPSSEKEVDYGYDSESFLLRVCYICTLFAMFCAAVFCCEKGRCVSYRELHKHTYVFG